MNIDRIISIIRSLKEEAPTNSTGTAVPGTGDDSSTVVVKKKKRQPTPVGRYGTRRTWLQNGKS